MSERAAPPAADAPSPRPLRVYVNERGVDVPPGATALDAARAHDPGEGDAVAAGTRLLTDSRGLPVDPASAAYGGAIYRLVPARRPAADAAPAASESSPERP